MSDYKKVDSEFKEKLVEQLSIIIISSMMISCLLISSIILKTFCIEL